MERNKQVYWFQHDYGTGSFFKCFKTDAPEAVVVAFPEFTWYQKKPPLPRDVIETLEQTAFDFDNDPAKDPILKALLDYRERNYPPG